MFKEQVDNLWDSLAWMNEHQISGPISPYLRKLIGNRPFKVFKGSVVVNKTQLGQRLKGIH